MNPILPDATIGIIGGGQLGKMLAEAANRMGYQVIVLDASPDAPAFSVAHHSIVAPLDDLKSIEMLVKAADVVTYEFENIDATIIKQLQQQYQNIPQGYFPLYVAQNRQREKEALVNAGIPVAPFVILNNVAQNINSAVKTLGFPLVVKTVEGGYDGKGQKVLYNEVDLAQLICLDNTNCLDNTSCFDDITCVAEKFIPYDKECSLIATRSTLDEWRVFPIVHNIHQNNILYKSHAKENIVLPAMAAEMSTMLQRFMTQNAIYGTLTMEVFIVGEQIYVNELAPRPHNSGHYTIEGCETSQFEQHIRAICGLPLGSTALRQETVMYNILGQHKTALLAYLPHLSPHAHLHLYGKKDFANNRKMGHITFSSLAEGERFEQAVYRTQQKTQ